jgi:hypothetical protein
LKALILFWLQVILAVIFTVSQLVHMFDSTEGLSIMFFFCQVSFASINLGLSIGALKSPLGDLKVKKQAVLIYGMWTVFSLSHFITSILLRAKWNTEDTRLTLIILISSALILLFAKLRNIEIINPWIRCALAMCFKTVPQFAVAIIIFRHGAEGWSPIFVAIGHLTICIRITQLALVLRKGINEHTLASLVTEIGSEISWITATVVYMIKI